MSQVCLLLYSLTMLHTFPDYITRVTESTYVVWIPSFLAFAFAASCYWPNFQSFFIGFMQMRKKTIKQLDWFASGNDGNRWRGHVLQWPSASVYVRLKCPLGFVEDKLQGCYSPINNDFIAWGILMPFTQVL